MIYDIGKCYQQVHVNYYSTTALISVLIDALQDANATDAGRRVCALESSSYRISSLSTQDQHTSMLQQMILYWTLDEKHHVLVADVWQLKLYTCI